MVQVYVARIEEKAPEEVYGALYEKASDYRKQKADRLKRPADKLRSLTAGALLNYGFRQYFQRLEAGNPGESRESGAAVSGKRKAEWKKLLEEGESNVCFDASGKPYIEIEGVSFNLSHAGIYVAAAVGTEPVGIDVEGGRPPSERIVARCHPQERDWYAAGNPEDEAEKAGKFWRLWTAKESVMKRDGRGIAMGLDSFSIFSEEWKREIYSLPLDEAYWLSLCTGEEWDKEVRRIKIETLL